MKLHIANYTEAPRYTVLAGEAIDLGAVILVEGDAAGNRTAFQCTDSDSALLVASNWGIAFAVSNDPMQVVDSTASAALGDRTLTISSGDQIVQVTRGAIMEYDVSLLHASLDPNRSGTLPVVGVALGIKGGLLSAAGEGGAITSPVVARVYDVLGGKVRVELV